MDVRNPPGNGRKQRNLWGIIRGHYGVEPDLSSPLWDLPLFLVAIKVFSSIPLFFLSRSSNNYYSLSFGRVVILVGFSILMSLFFYYLALAPALFTRFRISKKPTLTAGAVLLTILFLILHALELSAFYCVFLNQAIPTASGWITSLAAYGSYKILKYSDKPKAVFTN